MLDKLIEKGALLFDGAMGTFLQQSGLKAGELPELLNITNPDLIIGIHEKYLKAGSAIISTNTFGANRLKLEGTGYSVNDVIEAATKCACLAIGEHYDKYIALDVGPIGQLLKPMGTLSFDEAYEIYKEQVIAGEKAGCDLILIETQTDIYEAKIAVLAAKENTKLPVICTLSFEQNGRTFTGTDVATMANVLEGLDVDALGFNCSFGPKEMIPLVKELVSLTNKPILVQPNAGLPQTIKEITVYNTDENDFYDAIDTLRTLGVNHIGGCCGTSDTYIEKIRPLMIETLHREKVEAVGKVSSYAKTLEIAGSPIVIGERINPTGKKKLKEAIINNDIQYMVKEAISQADQGARILDVNIGLPEIDESVLMPQVIEAIQAVIDTPLQIDSSDIACLEQGARYYNGIPLINSVNGKEESLKAVLPIVKKYGAMVIGLTLDDTGIPSKAEDRLEVARKIVETAASYGIGREKIVIDCLALTASAQQEDVIETIKAIKLVKEELGVKTVLGVSNVSFGLPYRQLVNQTFFIMSLQAGLDLAIINPAHEEMMEAIDAYNVLVNNDSESKVFIGKYGHLKKRVNRGEAGMLTGVLGIKNETEERTLKTIIIKGLKEEARQAVETCLESLGPMAIVDEIIIPTLNEVGAKFESGEIFLPQLIQSAETVQNAFDRLKSEIGKADDFKGISKGKIVLATVQHDIHDIGKNIVKVILENYGFEVIDLGKDVPPQAVVEACRQHQIKLVGLSALMTSTVVSMEKTIQALKAFDSDIKVIVGGAVLNEDYAKMIKADHYAKDARETATLTQDFYKID